MNKNKMITW